MKSKKLITLIFTLFIIAMAVALFAILNAVDVKEKYDSQKNASVTIVKGDKSVVFDLVYLQQFEKVVFVARQDTSKTNAEEKVFSGVPLITVLEAKGLSLDGTKEVVFKAADGYTTVVTADEATDPGNVYLVYERDGKPSGTMEDGGTGPIEVLVAKDQFSQRWCKYLMEIKIQ